MQRLVPPRVARPDFAHPLRNPPGRSALRRHEAEENDMLKVFTVPLALNTPLGRVSARDAAAPRKPWWLIYRCDCGRRFTAMPPNLEPTG